MESVGGRDRFSGEPFRVRYHPSLEAEVLADEGRALAVLETHREREQALQRSLYGPHLDRFDFYLADRNVRHYASSGQKRGALLTVYLDVMDLFQQARGHLPVVLIDDVDMELDLPRIRTLLAALDRRTQLFPLLRQARTLPGPAARADGLPDRRRPGFQHLKNQSIVGGKSAKKPWKKPAASGIIRPLILAVHA